MKKILFLTIFKLLFAINGNAQAPLYSIFDALERQPKPGEGVVVIHQPDAIKRLVGTRIDSENIDLSNGKTHLKTMGYRIQVYSGNNQRTSKDETMNLQAKIKELYPGVETYPIFIAPFWKLYVGDYLTFEEASVMRRELQKLFAQHKNEIYIVEDEIRLLLN